MEISNPIERDVKCKLGCFTSAVFLHDKERFVASTSEGWIYQYQINPFEEIRQLPLHSKAINKLKISSNGRYILSASDDMTCCLIHSDNFTKVNDYQGALAELTCCDISNECDLIVGAGVDTMIHLWAPKKSDQINLVSAHTEPINSIQFSQDATFLLTSSSDGLCRIWETTSLICLRTFFINEQIPVTCAILSPSEQNVIASYANNTINIFDISSSHIIQEVHKHVCKETVSSLTCLGDKDDPTVVYLIVPSEDGRVICYNIIEDNQIVWSLQVNKFPLIAMDSDCEYLFVADSENETFSLYNKNS